MFDPLRTVAASATLLALWLWAAAAAAQGGQGEQGEQDQQGERAEVTVKVRDKSGQPAEARVELKDSEGKTVVSCTTEAGSCQMSGIAGGSYAVHLSPRVGSAPKPSKAMIPPQGKVTLIVSTGS